MKIRQYHWAVIYAFLLTISLLLVWVNQTSINAYWQQTYHTASVLHKLEGFSLWRKGAEIQAYFVRLTEDQFAWIQSQEYSEVSPEENVQETGKTRRPAFGEASVKQELERLGYVFKPKTEIKPFGSYEFKPFEAVNFMQFKQGDALPPPVSSSQPELHIAVVSEQTASSQTTEQKSVEKPAEELEAPKVEGVESVHSQNETPIPADVATQIPNGKVLLTQQDMVFFAGDSLMQGVAPHLQQWLSRQGVKSLNLSKQSTGLSYPKFFNWPATIEENLQKYPAIKLLVVFLGPNDPWDIPNPEDPKSRYLRFKEDKWESTYRHRISQILDTARKFNVSVMWLQVPNMRAQKLNMQMAYLNEVFETETQNRALFIPTKSLLSAGKNEYRESILINGKETRVRSKDGIHFTPAGMKLIANHITQYIEIKP